MGRTSSDERNDVRNIDSRQINETNTEVEQDLDFDDSSENQNTAGRDLVDIATEIDDSNNTTIDDSGNQTLEIRDSNNQTFTDDSEGQINATGNVTIESEAVSLAAIQAANFSAELATRASERASEALQNGFAKFSAELGRTNARSIDGNVKVSEAAFDFSSLTVDALQDVSRTALGSNEAIARAAFTLSEAALDENAGIISDALDTSKGIVEFAFDANATGFETSLEFLEGSLSNSAATVEATFDRGLDFLSTNLQDANELSSNALSDAFKSTVGGLAEQQQKTLLIGLGMVAVVLVIIFFAGGLK